MRKDVGQAAIQVGTNVLTAGIIGLAFIDNGAKLVSAFAAIAFGYAFIYYGVKYRDGDDS